MTIKEIETKIRKDYPDIFKTLKFQLCPNCHRYHPLTTMEKTIIELTLISAFLAGQMAGLDEK